MDGLLNLFFEITMIASLPKCDAKIALLASQCKLFLGVSVPIS